MIGELAIGLMSFSNETVGHFFDSGITVVDLYKTSSLGVLLL